MNDLSREQAVRWVAREASRLHAYDEIIERLEAERRILERAGEDARRYPVTAQARRTLVKRLEARLDGLRRRLH